jgi:hypothetical protein
VIKSGTMNWVDHLVRIGKENDHEILVLKQEEREN